MELSTSICKTDLTSDLVGEFPELQGIMDILQTIKDLIKTYL